MQLREFLKSRERLAVSFAVAITAVLWVWALWPRPAVLTVAFLSVGQGDAAVITTPSGRTVLVDTGPCKTENGGFDAGPKVVVPYLRRHGVNAVDALVLSHPHEDHIGGASAVIRSFRVRTVLDPGLAHPSGVYADMLEDVRDRHIPYRRLISGQSIDLKDGVTIEVIEPDSNSAADANDLNNTSAVLRLNYGRVHFLLPGDAELDEESEMLSEGRNTSANVLKVPHHGSARGTSEEWLAAVDPQVAVISVGWRNQFGLPSDTTLERLSSRNIRTYRTDESGTVTVTTDGRTIRVTTAR